MRLNIKEYNCEDLYDKLSTLKSSYQLRELITNRTVPLFNCRHEFSVFVFVSLVNL